MSDLETLQAEASQFKEDFGRILQEVHKVIVGQERVVECAVTALLAGGNVLLEGVPGLGKTELVKTLGHVLDLEFRRIQSPRPDAGRHHRHEHHDRRSRRRLSV